jgi:ribosomal protein L19
MATSPIIAKLLAKAQRTDLPSFRPGDTVRVAGKDQGR